MRRKTLVLLMFILIAPLLCISTTMTFAVVDNDGDDSGSSGAGGDGTGSHKCGYNLCSSYGATWRWYEADSDEIKIPGTVNGYGEWSPGYARDTVIRDCKDEGGYWRYALVAERTKVGAKTTDFAGRQLDVYKGDQVGTLAIGAGGAGGTFTSQKLGGGTVYREEYDHGMSWDDIKDLYLQSKEQNPAKFSYEWNEFSNLGWFCAPNPYKDAPTYYSESNASAKEGYERTGIVENGEAYAPSVTLKVGESTPIAFSHNIYSSGESEDVYWQIQRRVESYVDEKASSGTFIQESKDGVNYSIDTSGEAESYDGRANLTLEGDYSIEAHWTAEKRKYVNEVGEEFLIRDVYNNVTFNKVGSYTFCETMYIGSPLAEHTKACVEIDVVNCDPNDPKCGVPEKPPETNECEKWTPASYYRSNESEGWTSVIAATKNSSLRNPAYNNWIQSNGNGSDFPSGKEVWAKPGDTINWLHCYYPGVQEVAFTEATRSHHAHTHSDGGRFPNNNDSLSRIVSWENKFTITNDNLIKADGSRVSLYNSPNFATGLNEIKMWREKPAIESYKVSSLHYSRAGKDLREINTSGTPSYARVRFGDYSWSWTCNCTTDEDGNTSCETCSADHGSNNYLPYTIQGPASDAAMVKVPYNYSNTIKVAIDKDKKKDCGGDGNEHVVCAGEKVTISSADVTVHPVYNSVTEGTYATRVNGSETRLFAFVSGYNRTNSSVIAGNGAYANICDAIVDKGECALIDVDKGENDDDYAKRDIDVDGCEQAINCIEKTSGTSEAKFSGRRYNVFDASAGYWYCVVAAVYPASSGEPTSMRGEPGNAGDGQWRVSKADCVRIAKQPSIQVWGNSLYTAGDVETSTSIKRTVWGYGQLGYIAFPNADTDNNITLFGSWVEQAIFAPKSDIIGLASGAAMGRYSSGNNVGSPSTRTPVKKLGGSYEGNLLTTDETANFCIRSPLTMPNSKCKESMYIDELEGTSGGYSSIENSKQDNKSSILGRFFAKSSSESGSVDSGFKFGDCVEATRLTTDENKLATVCKEDEKINITGLDAKIGKTYLYHATNADSNNGGVIITGDILYPYNDNDTEEESKKGYSSLYEIPKVIIYSEGNITISCSVERVDAVLIANGNIDTCPEVTAAILSKTSVGKQAMLDSSTQLKIFGTIITNTMTPSRTYGAATGKYSGVPAEIIDYDTSLYLWGMSRATVNKSGKAEVTYQTELSPRY